MASRSAAAAGRPSREPGLGRRAIAAFRLTPFDVSTVEGRSRERNRRIALAAATTAVARVVGVAAALVSVPLTLGYLGTERYGLWTTISSTVALLSFADLGLGNGLVSAVAAAHGRDDRAAAREQVSSALVLLGTVALALGAAFALAYPHVGWARLFNVSSLTAQAEAGPAVAVFVACVLIHLPLGVVQRVQMGLQESFASAGWQVVASIVGLAALLAAIALRASLPWLVLALAGAPVAAAAVNTAVVFARRHPWLRPSVSHVSRAGMRRLAASGSLFLVLQVAGAVAFQTDNLVIARYLGAAAVAEYAVPMKLFAMVPMLLGFVLAPLWPAYGEAIARRDILWVRRTFRRLLVLSCAVAAAAAGLLVAVGPWLLDLWVGGAVRPSTLLLTGCALWAVLNAVSGSFAMLLNGANVVGFQVVTATLMAAVNLPLSIFLVSRVGLPGPILGSVIAVVCVTIVPTAFYIPRLFAAWARDAANPASQ